MKTLQSLILHILLGIIFLIISAEALSKASAPRFMVKQELEFPNDEKHVLARKIEYKKDHNIATIFAIQVVHGDQRYFVQDDYAERNIICQAFGFIEAFNEKGDTTLTAPITSSAKAYQMVKLEGDDNELIPYSKTDRSTVSMIEILPCKMSHPS